MRRLISNRGLSLVEVLVAMLLLVIGLLALVTQWPLGTRMVLQSEYYTRASVLAEQILEELDAGTFPPTAGTRTVAPYTIQWTVASGPHAQTRRVSVQVRWTWQGRTHSVTMHTLIGSET